jgi:hypothetical protein
VPNAQNDGTERRVPSRNGQHVAPGRDHWLNWRYLDRQLAKNRFAASVYGRYIFGATLLNKVDVSASPRGDASTPATLAQSMPPGGASVPTLTSEQFSQP